MMGLNAGNVCASYQLTIAGVCLGFRWLRETRAPARPSTHIEGRGVVMSEDHRKALAELVITDLERAAGDYRTMAATASTHSDRDSHNRVANGFERMAERRRAGVAPLKIER